MRNFAIDKNDQIITIFKIAIYKHGQVIAILQLYKSPLYS
jgi:hypothetical protein